MKKITSVLLALLLVISMFAFASCEKEPKELLAEADKTLAEKPYTMTMKIGFSSDNEEVNQVFQLMNIEVPVTIDGDKMLMDMSMDANGTAMVAKMSLIDKVLYYNIQMDAESIKMKATLSDEQIAAFKKDQSAEMPVDYTQFSELKAEKKDGKTIITCTGITDEGKKILNDQMAASIESMGGSASIGELSYTLTLKNGKYEAIDLTCTYSVTVAGQSVSATMTMGSTISYDNIPAITAPSDADSYTSVNYSDLFGG